MKCRFDMQITLPQNSLYHHEQTVTFEKVTALIGENGAGKSSILQSIFNNRLLESGYFHNKKIVCFSSGQNEKYSKSFSEYLAKERQANRGLNLGCCYYDKSWSSLLIFIATMMKQGFVRNFLTNKDYVDLSADGNDDISSTLKVNIRVEKPYVNRVNDALKEEENGKENTFRTSGYHQTLESFIRTIIDNDYEFEEPIKSNMISLSSDNFFNPSFANPEKQFFEPIITFFTQAADNDYFFDKQSMQLIFKNELTLNDLSDGEYQILFLYALLDLFDSEETLFLLDEVDSHLHYKNIENLWSALHAIQGHTLTTTHLVDSIIQNGLDSLKIVDRGAIKEEEEKTKALLERLSALSKMSAVKFEICCHFDHIALMDDYNDWLIFLALVRRKGLNADLLACVKPIKQTSSYGNINEKFGKAKFDWVTSLLSADSDKQTKNLFLICDRDNAEIEFKQDGVSVTGHNEIITETKKGHQRLGLHLLAWRRREIKNYLLSHTALSYHGLLKNINNDKIAPIDYLKADDPADNDTIRKLDVKAVISQIIDTKGVGLDKHKLDSYINQIPPTEISEDIDNMYNFIVSKLP